MTQKAIVRMTEKKREMILRLADNYYPALPIIHFIESLLESDKIFHWLISHGFTGSRLCDFLSSRFNNKLLDMTQFLLEQVDKNRQEGKPIVVGRDIR